MNRLFTDLLMCIKFRQRNHLWTNPAMRHILVHKTAREKLSLSMISTKTPLPHPLPSLIHLSRQPIRHILQHQAKISDLAVIIRVLALREDLLFQRFCVRKQCDLLLVHLDRDVVIMPTGEVEDVLLDLITM